MLSNCFFFLVMCDPVFLFASALCFGGTFVTRHLCVSTSLFLFLNYSDAVYYNISLSEYRTLLFHSIQ